MAEQLSKRLSGMLNQKDLDTIENLLNFPEMLEAFDQVSGCTPEERENILKKEEQIISLTQKIVDIKNKHISNEEKKSQLQELLKNNENILEEITDEMLKVGKILIERAKQASQKQQQQEEKDNAEKNNAEKDEVENDKPEKENKRPQLSRGLKKVLTEQEKKTIDSLFNVSEMVEKFFATSVCTPEERESIVKKETALLHYVSDIMKISRDPSIKLERKKELIREILGAYEDIKQDLQDEIDKVAKLMQEKAKEASEALQKQYGVVKANFDQMIDGNVEIEAEKENEAKKKAEEAKKKQEKLEEERKKKEKEENQLVEYKGSGFREKFHQIRTQENDGKRPGVIKSAIGAIKELYAEKKELEQKVKDSPEMKARKQEIEAIDAEYQAAVEAENQAKEDEQIARENQKKLLEQKKELEEQYVAVYEEALEEAKAKFDESRNPVPEEEITEERVGGLLDRVKAFWENRREIRHERKVGRLNAKIGDLTEEINDVSAEHSRLQDQKAKEGANDELDKDIAYDEKLIKKKQAKRESLVQKVKKANERYGGQDR